MNVKNIGCGKKWESQWEKIIYTKKGTFSDALDCRSHEYYQSGEIITPIIF